MACLHAEVTGFFGSDNRVSFEKVYVERFWRHRVFYTGFRSSLHGRIAGEYFFRVMGDGDDFEVVPDED